MDDKKSFLRAAMIGTIGIFLTKIIGVLYVIPWYNFKGIQINLPYYSYSYALYSFLFVFSTMGIPRGISSLVSKYDSFGNQMACKKILKYGILFTFIIGLFFAAGMYFFSMNAARLYAPSTASIEFIENVSTTIKILSLSLIIVPMIAMLRGYYEGYKLVAVSSLSQLIEQIVRVAYLLISSYIIIYILDLDPLYAIYHAVFATLVSAIAVLLYLMLSYYRNKKTFANANEKANLEGTNENVKVKLIARELIIYALPFLISNILGNLDLITDPKIIGNALVATGLDYMQAANVYANISGQVSKLLSLPQVVSLSFPMAIIPYVSREFLQKNFARANKHINDVIRLVLYFTIPVCLMYFLMPEHVYFSLYGRSEFGYSVLRAYAITGITISMNGVLSTILLTIDERRSCIMYFVILTVIRLVILYPLILVFQIYGGAIAAVISSFIMELLVLRKIKKVTKIRYVDSIRVLVVSLISCIPIVLVVLFGKMLYSDFEENRMYTLLFVIVTGLICMILYLLVSAMFGIPQKLLNIRNRKDKSRISSGR